MKLVSWNVNGIRACLQKGFLNSFHQLDADIFCVQETKMQSGQADLEIEGYHYYLNSAVKKGYSGTLIYSKEKPLNVFYGMNKEEHDQEGRLITLEFENYYVITCYTPNSQNELKRLSYRMKWEDDFLTYLESLDKPIILCGDLNVAHQEIDLKNPKSNRKNAGFSDEEREKVEKVIRLFDFDFVGIDFIFNNGKMVFNEIEDVVGSRMVYTYTDIDIVEMYVDYILEKVVKCS